MMINKRLINLCRESKKYIGLTVLVNWVAIICNILIIILLGQAINKLYIGERLVIENNNIIMAMKKFFITDNISLLNGVIIILIILLIRYFSNILYGKFSNLSSEKVRTSLREAIYIKLLRLGNSYKNTESTSSIAQISVEGIEALEVYFGKYLPQFFYAMIAPVTLFICLLFFSPKAATVFILCVPLIPISIIAIMKIAKKILKNYWKSYSNLGDTFLDNLQGLTTLKVFDMDKQKHEQMNNEAEKFRKITMKVLSMQLNSINVMDLIAYGGAAIGTAVGIIQFINGEIMIGSLFIIIMLSSEFFIPLRLLGSFFHIAMNGMAAADRIFNLLDAKERKKYLERVYTYNEEDDFIKLENVDFSYDGKRKILKNINISVSKGEVVGIVGESGSGKSTIASLLLNKFEVLRGEVKLKGVNVDTMLMDDIYENIALVSTNSYIFNGSILDNLLMGNPKASEEEVLIALNKSRLYDFVSSLKNGLNTRVGENGSFLSGGQKQRVALARAILSNREMIIFDEATSNIDVESEEAILEAIMDLSKEKTIILISHRLANVKIADKIYVMKMGEVIESGNHNELYNEKNEYYKLLKSQEELESIREGN